MGHFFSDSNNRTFGTTSSPIAAPGPPMSIACWFNAVGTAAAKRTLCVVGGTSGGDGHLVRLNGTAIEGCTTSGASTATAIASGAFTAGVWTHAAAVFVSATSRTAYRDGANSGSDATNLTPTSASFNRVGIGADRTINANYYGNGNGGGDIAHLGIWNVALTADDVAALGAGVSPLLIRPEGLVLYSPLWTLTINEVDYQSSIVLDSSGLTIAFSTTEPKVYWPGRQQLSSPTAVPAVDTSHTIKILLNGSDITANSLISSLRIEEVATKDANQAHLRVRNMTPPAGQSLIITEGPNRRFGGLVSDMNREPREAITVAKIHTLDALDYSYLLNQRLIQKAYTSQAIDVIVKDIIDTYCPGLTRANVDNLLSSVSIAFDFETVPSALDRLAALAGAGRWKVDYFGDLHFRISSFTPNPSSLTSSPTYPFRNFGYRKAVRGVVTRLYLIGNNSSTTAAAAVAATSIAVSDTTIFQGSGTRKATTGQNRISYTGTSTASGPGNLTGVTGVTYAINQGDSIALFAQADDATAQSTLAALDGTDGIKEMRLVDTTISLYADLVTQATAKLSTMSAITETVTYTTEDPVTTPGGDVVVNVDGISTTLQIQRQALYAVENTTHPLQRDVEASTEWTDFNAMLNAVALRAAKVG